MNSQEDELLLEARDLLQQDKTVDKDQLICECCSVSLYDIREFVNGNIEDVDLDLLKKELKLGSGCSSCINNFDQWKSWV